MTIKQLKKVHAEIMDLIIKSGSDAATVTFRRFNDGDFMVSFYDTGFFNPKEADIVWLHSSGENGAALVDRVRAFLFVNAPAKFDTTPVTRHTHAHAQQFPAFKPTSPETDDEYYG